MSGEEISSFPIWVGKLRKGIQRRQTEVLKPYGLSSIHSLYLSTLWYEEEGMTLRELCEKICVDKANTSRVIAMMEKLSYVERISSKCGKLKCRIRLTDSGRVIAKEVVSCMHQVHDIMLHTLTKEEFETIYNVIKKLSEIEDLT